MNDYKLLELENQTFHSTIQKLRDYANLNDDWYINTQLDLIEVEIKIEINKAKASVYKKINNNK
jgi:hypothetical protein